jgi:hypothetical protein
MKKRARQAFVAIAKEEFPWCRLREERHNTLWFIDRYSE